MAHITIHDHSVNYDDSHDRLKHAVKYLEYDLSRAEADVFFHQAKEVGSARFEDNHGVNLKLKREGGEYFLSLSDEY